MFCRVFLVFFVVLSIWWVKLSRCGRWGLISLLNVILLFVLIFLIRLVLSVLLSFFIFGYLLGLLVSDVVICWLKCVCCFGLRSVCMVKMCWIVVFCKLFMWLWMLLMVVVILGLYLCLLFIVVVSWVLVV